jgi:hypothetical protein
MVSLCCETAGFTCVYEMNRVKRISLNECVSNAGHSFYTEHKRNSFIDIERYATTDTSTYVCSLDRNF